MAGKGTIRERSPGSWQLRVYLGRDGHGKPIQVSRTFKGGKRQAQAELARLLVQVEDRGAPLKGAVTVAELLERWLDHITPQRQPGTVRGHRTCTHAVIAEIGHVRLSKLTAQELDRAYARWLAAGLAPATVRRYHSVLAAGLHQARRWGLVTQAVTDLASPPPMHARPPTVPDPAAVQALVITAENENPVLAMAIVLAAITGARLGELCGLRWSDIDLEHNVLHIRRAVKHGLDKRELVVGPTKTHQHRKVSLDPTALALLAGHRQRVESWAAQGGVSLLEDGYVLPGGPAWGFDPSGAEPLKPDTVTSAFARLAERCRAQVRFHDLRHFSATQLIGAGVDVRTVAYRLGHADPSTTLRVYSHALAERDREAAAILGKLIVRPANGWVPDSTADEA
ncbi:MAG TPA: tyrosine-type recombinase/integrase [Acidimicrobiales bacterium]|nr:tyrosine-type recombinase/integrase [Acidimicrobiales bacterium]